MPAGGTTGGRSGEGLGTGEGRASGETESDAAGAGLELGSTVATQAERPSSAARKAAPKVRRRLAVSTRPSLAAQGANGRALDLFPRLPRVSRTLRIASPPTMKNTTYTEKVTG